MSDASISGTGAAEVIGAVDAATGGSGVLLLMGVLFFVGLLWLIIKFIKDITSEHRHSTKEITDTFAKTVDKGHDVIRDNTQALADLRVAVAQSSPQG